MTKIVYIDSENSIRELYSHLLEAAGYQVYQATTAQYGMWLCEESTPDLIITTRAPVDAELEERAFIDVLRELAGQVPVVVVSHDDADTPNSGNGKATDSDPHRYLELMKAIHRALDDGIGEFTVSGAQTSEGAASSIRP